jgi:hypothetical protein
LPVDFFAISILDRPGFLFICFIDGFSNGALKLKLAELFLDKGHA